MTADVQSLDSSAESLRPIKPNPGSELDPANFVGRDDVTARAQTMLEARQNILLGDPRRMGKSFWIATFAHRMNSSGALRVIMIDYQGVDTVEEFLRLTVEHLSRSQRVPRRFLDYASALFDNIPLDAEVALGPVTLKKAVRDSEASAAQLLENILIRLDDETAADIKDSKKDRDKAGPLVIAMDEVSDALLSIAARDPRAADNLLRRLRHLRHQATHIRWIVAGSVGFHHVLARCGAGEDVLNDLNTLPFGPLDAADSTLLTRRLALGIRRDIAQDAVDAMFAVTDGMPYLIQKLADTMRYDDRNQPATSPITASEVAARFDAFLNDRDLSRDVTQFVSRIDRYYGDHVRTAFAILDHVAAGPASTCLLAEVPESLRSQSDFALTLRNLIDDHYLTLTSTPDGDRLTWRYPALRTIYVHRRSTRG